MFPALGLGQLGCAGCASSPACSVWWCVGAGPDIITNLDYKLNCFIIFIIIIILHILIYKLDIIKPNPLLAGYLDPRDIAS